MCGWISVSVALLISMLVDICGSVCMWLDMFVCVVINSFYLTLYECLIVTVSGYDCLCVSNSD